MKYPTGASRLILSLAAISFCVTAAVWYLLPSRPGFAIEDGLVAALSVAPLAIVVSRVLT